MKHGLLVLCLVLIGASSATAQDELYGLHNNTGWQRIAHIVPDSMFVDPGPLIPGTQGYVLGSSTYDAQHDRYIAIAATNSGLDITVVDPISGNIQNQFPSIYNLTELEYDENTGTCWGLLWDGTTEWLAQIDVDSGNVHLQWQLPGVNIVVSGSSTFDQAGQRYIFISNQGITVVNTANGTILGTFPSQSNLSELEYDPVTENCFGMYAQNNIAHLAEVDLSAQTITDLGPAGFSVYVAGATSFNAAARSYAALGDGQLKLIDVDNNTVTTSFSYPNNLSAIEFGINQTDTTSPPPPPPTCDTTAFAGAVWSATQSIEAGMVYAYLYDSLANSFTLADSASIDSGGQYLIFNPGPGAYALQAVPDAGWYPTALPTWLGNDTVTSGATILYVNNCSGLSGALDIMVFEQAAPPPPVCDTTAFSGQITLGSDPLANATVYLISLDSNGTAWVVDSTYADSMGLYEFRPVMAGNYLLQAAADAGLYPTAVPTYLGNIPTWSFSTGLVVGSCDGPYPGNNISIIDIQPLLGTNTVTGTISQVNRNNTPLANIMVMLTDANGNVVASALTDANGTYVFANVPAGTYTIVVEVLNHHMASMHSITVQDGTQQQVSYDYELEDGAFSAVQGTISFTSEFGSLQQVSVWPNPAVDLVQITGNGLTADAQLRVVDMTGRTVLLHRASTANTAQLNVAKLAPGSYLLLISNATSRQVHKLQIQ